MNKLIISSVLVGVLSVGYLALAEEGTNRPNPSVSPKPSIRVKAQEQKDQLKQNIKDVKTNVKTEIKDARVELKNRTETGREDLKKRQEEFHDQVKAKREMLKEEVEAKRKELKTHLEKVKDERKKETVERIDQRMDALNDKMMRHFSVVLDKLEEVLVRINERADKVSTERGHNVSSVRSAIDKANTAIALARVAIENQSGKTYTINVTVESALKSDVGRARQDLHADLAKVKDAVKSAHSAVRDAAVALAQLVIKINASPSPSVSPSATPVQ